MRIYDVKTKILKTIFVVIALILLYSNWLVTTDGFEYDWSQYMGEVSYILNMASWMTSGTDLSGIENMIECVIDGKFTPVETTTVFYEFIKGTETIGYIFGSSLSDINVDELYGVLAYGVCYIVIFVSTIILGVVVLFHVWKNNKATYEQGFFATYIFLGCFTTFICIPLYDAIGEWAIRPTIFLIIGIVGAMPTSLIQMLPFYNFNLPGKMEVQETLNKGINIASNYGEKLSTVSLNKWECKSCGKKNNQEAKFCSFCGKKKSEKIACTNCGFEIDDDDIFCKNCGIKFEQVRNTCSNCGCSIDKQSEYCEFCGIKVNN